MKIFSLLIILHSLSLQETTAHTLAYALGLLALYPEEQEKLYQESKSLPENPTFDIYSSLTRCQAIFNETLRLWPPVPHQPKRAVQDCFIPCRSTQSSDVPIQQTFVPKDARLLIDIMGLGMNPHLWEDAANFNPNRFIDTEDYKWNRSAFVPFSQGNRSCLGRQFALAEGAILLALISRRYRIELREADSQAYKQGTESFTSMRDRVLDSDLKSKEF